MSAHTESRHSQCQACNFNQWNSKWPNNYLMNSHQKLHQWWINMLVLWVTKPWKGTVIFRFSLSIKAGTNSQHFALFQILVLEKNILYFDSSFKFNSSGSNWFNQLIEAESKFNILIQENVVWKMFAILSQPQCVNSLTLIRQWPIAWSEF